VPSAGAATFTVDLSAYAGESVYIAFLHRQNNGDFFYLDNVIVPAPVPAVAPTLDVSFVPDTVETNADSVLTVTLVNAGAVDAILTAPFVNVLPSGLMAGPMTTTCAAPAGVEQRGGGIVLPAGHAIPANGSCVVEATVQAVAAGSYVDTIAAGDLQTDQGSNAEGASATLTVTEPVVPDPIAVVTPIPLDFIIEEGQSLTRTLTIGNTGEGQLDWSIAEAVGATQHVDFGNVRAAAYDASATLVQGDAVAGPRAAGAAILLGEAMISQMQDNTPDVQGVSCGANDGSNTGDNSWWRRFYFDEHPEVGATANVTAVTVSSGGNAIASGLPFTINLYTIDHDVAADTIPTASLTLIGSASSVVSDALTSVTVPVTGSIDDTANLDLVVEYHTDGVGSGRFFPGANDTPETHPTFMSSATCAITEPVTATSLGFPDFHLTMMVTLGDGGTPAACENPADVAWLGATPTSGTVAPGASTDVDVSADAGTLAAGDYSANLCVTTNDPLQPLITVPVNLTVTPAPPEPPAAQVTPTALKFAVEAGGSTSGPLDITNVGGSDLAWSIAESAAGENPGYRTARTAKTRMSAAGASLQQDRVVHGSQGFGQPLILGESMISQMEDNTPGDFGISCGTQGVSTADNSWWRRFYFDEHPQVGASASIESVTVSSGSIAIPGGLPITINLYTIPHATPIDTIPTASLTLIGSANATITDTLASITVPVTGTVHDTAGQDLVVEYFTAGNASGGQFFPGANDTPETHPTFLSSATCSLLDPGTAASVGFPDFHLTMVVNLGDGNPQGACENPSDLPWLAQTPSSGTLAPGASADVTVGVDATALDAGEYAANVCVTTNDPLQPLVTVPVSLTVNPAPITDRVFCAGFESGETGDCDATPPIDEDIVDSGPLDVPLLATFDGTWINWATGDIGDGSCPAAVCNWNPYLIGDGLTFYWPESASNEGGVSLDGLGYAVLEPGAVIGPSSQFIAITAGADYSDWRAGSDGYLGFRFACAAPGGFCYGYAHLTTTAGNGFPATLVRYFYNSTGDPITIP
jgi:hypothetical protein